MIADEIRDKIREIEKQPESRLKTLRLTGLQVLLDRINRQS